MGGGSRSPQDDETCDVLVGGSNASGYCECGKHHGVNEISLVKLHTLSCIKKPPPSPSPPPPPPPPRPLVTCQAICAAGGEVRTTALHATVAKGPIMHEARIQVTPQHSEVWRIYQSTDEMLGRRLEFGLSIGI